MILSGYFLHKELIRAYDTAGDNSLEVPEDVGRNYGQQVIMEDYSVSQMHIYQMAV